MRPLPWKHLQLALEETAGAMKLLCNEFLVANGTPILLKMPSVTLYRVALVRPDVSENVSSASSGVFRLIDVHSCVIVETLLLIPRRHVLRNVGSK
jgi:hypothetical protein